MKKLTQAEYDAALVLHEKWLNDEKGGVRMTFVKFDFSDIDFGESANLQSADLQWANLRSADLRSADLRWANLQWADLQWANLRSANLQWADLDFSAFPLWCGELNLRLMHAFLRRLLHISVRSLLMTPPALRRSNICGRLRRHRIMLRYCLMLCLILRREKRRKRGYQRAECAARAKLRSDRTVFTARAGGLVPGRKLI